MTLPLAFLHGFTGTPEGLGPVLEELQTVTSRVVVPILCGHGPNGTPNAGSFEAEVDRLAALLRVEAPRFHLAGYSLGGRVAVGLLARHPALFATATLFGAQPGLASDAERAARRGADEKWCDVLVNRGIEAFVAAWEALPLFATQSRLPLAVRERQRAERLGRDPEGLCRSLRSTGLGAMPDYAPALERLDIPTTWVAGALDEKFSQIAERMASRMPNATSRIVEDSGHNVPLENRTIAAQILASALKVHP